MSALDVTAILVAGMHRSGTSALAGTLNMLGISLGENLLAAGSDNPKGYWEHQDAVAIHERLLAALDRRWDDVRPLPAGWLSSDAAKAASAEISELILHDFAESRVWAVKDPRICRLLPLWINVLCELRIKPVVLFAARNPSEVAASIEARNHWAAPVGEMLWLRHVLEAEAASRSLPRTAVIYDDLLSDPLSVVSSAMARLGVQISKPSRASHDALVHFVDRADRHHAHVTVAESGSAIASLAGQAYKVLVEIAHGDEGAWPMLRDCATRFHAEWRQYGAPIEAVADMAHRFSMNEVSARIEAAELSSKLNAQIRWSEEAVEIRTSLKASYDEQVAKYDELTAKCDEQAAKCAEQAAKCDEFAANCEKLRAEQGEVTKALESANADVASLGAMIGVLHQSWSWRVTRPLRALTRLLRPDHVR
jgi:hypothetical protein